jgi:two-component system sensor histidine kinase/response regulator
VVFDTHLRCLVWNTFLEQRSGLSASDVFGKHVFELFPFIQTNGLLQMMERALLGETVDFPDTHIPVPAPDGAWITGTYSPLRNGQNEIIGVINTTTSITQRKKMEEEKSRLLLETQALNENLKISEQKLQEAQKIARLATWEFDLKRWEMEWSEELFRFFGLDPASEQPSFDECLEMIDPEFRESTQQIIAQASRWGSDFELEIKVLPKDTAFRWTHSLGRAIFNDAGEVVKLLGVSYDITERKVAEEQIRQLLRDSQDLNNRLLAGEEALQQSLSHTLALNQQIQQSEQRWQYALEGSGDGVWDWNLQTNAVYYSKRLKEFLGYREEDKITDLSQWTLKLHPEDKDWVFEALNKHIRGETESYQAEYRALGKNNQYHWLLGRGKVLEKDENGRAIRMIGTITDTTERKEIEEKLKQQNVDLQKINAELDSFVYRTSHDLRSPLSSLLGLINISRIETEESQKELYLNLMEKSVSKLDIFISDIINHSRNSRIEITQEEIQLPVLLQDTLDGLRFLENFSSIEKTMEINQETPFVSDIFRLKIICNNLLSNAIKYRSPSAATAHIRIRAQVTRERAVFEFQDNGVGIPKESLEKIFTMFYRATAISNGSGLGLYIVKEVVQTLQGQISVQSELGKGTAFRVELPNSI